MVYVATLYKIVFGFPARLMLCSIYQGFMHNYGQFTNISIHPGCIYRQSIRHASYFMIAILTKSGTCIFCLSKSILFSSFSPFSFRMSLFRQMRIQGQSVYHVFMYRFNKGGQIKYLTSRFGQFPPDY